MVSGQKVSANRANAKRSTGPKSAGGKAKAKQNAIAHGLRSILPVIAGESAKDWNAHLAGIVEALAPVGTLEIDLAGRVALMTWRLRRVVVYETAAIAAGINSATAKVRGERDENDSPTGFSSRHFDNSRTWARVRNERNNSRQVIASCEHTRDQLRQLVDAPDDQKYYGQDAMFLLREATEYTPSRDENDFEVEDAEFLDSLGVPEGWQEEPEEWDGWTARMIRAGLKVIATDEKMTGPGLITHVIAEADRRAMAERQRAERLEVELAELGKEIEGAERLAASQVVIPGADLLDKVMRYESHLAKQLTQTLHLLERLQNVRAGNPVPPPAALDVTIDAGGLSMLPAGVPEAAGTG